MIMFDSPLNHTAVGKKIRSLSISLAENVAYSAMALTEAEAVAGGLLDRLLAG